jgi:hypothetical protein
MAGGLKDGGDPKAAARSANASRTAPAGKYDGGKPPSGPKPEPVRINGIRAPKESGLSK